jgi:branched-subunit amino acid aminotransferase/4-amino-4-deoxychorismate lyase
MEPIAYLNGQFIPNSECKLAIYDGGIVLGAAVTDLVRTYGGVPYALDDHSRRFLESARYAYLELGLTVEDIGRMIGKLIEHNRQAWPGREIAVVYYATVGEFPVYAGAAGMAGERKPTICFHCFPMPFELWRGAVSEGVTLVTPTQRHVPPNTLSSKIKHRNRLHMWIGDSQARLVDPKAVGLYLDVNGNVTETGGSNFLIYRKGTIISPRRPNILWGVSLETVIRLGEKLGIPFREDDLQIHDVVNASEAWLCTTPYFLAPVVKLNGLPIGTGRPGPVWKQLVDAFSAEIGFDTLAQILG